MEMASANVKIRHFFGFTTLTERSIGAGPTVIIQLSGYDMYSGNARYITFLSMYWRFRAGSFSGLLFRIQVLAHMPC